MSDKTTIYIVHHGQSETNVLEVLQTVDFSKWGKGESPLTGKGTQQAEKVAKKLRNIKFDAIFSSYLTRAKQTADIIARGRNLINKPVANIHERIFGTKYFSLPPEERKKLKKALINLNEQEKLEHKPFADMESHLEALNRFSAFLTEIIPLYAGKTILVVSHGTIMRTFLITQGYAKFDELPFGSVVNCGYFVLETDGKKHKIKETFGVNKKV